MNGDDIIETDVDIYQIIFPQTQGIRMIVPDGSNNLKHFLNCSGEDVEMDVKSLLFWSTYARNLYNDYILKLKQYAEDTIKIGDNLVIGSKAIDTDNDGKSDGLIAFSRGEGVAGCILDMNWFTAYGECNAYLVGNVKHISEKTYEGTSKYMVFDMYNWLPNSPATLLEGIIPTDGELHKLHEAGLAREFYQSGTHVDKLSWESKPWIL